MKGCLMRVHQTTIWPKPLCLIVTRTGTQGRGWGAAQRGAALPGLSQPPVASSSGASWLTSCGLHLVSVSTLGLSLSFRNQNQHFWIPLVVYHQQYCVDGFPHYPFCEPSPVICSEAASCVMGCSLVLFNTFTRFMTFIVLSPLVFSPSSWFLLLNEVMEWVYDCIQPPLFFFFFFSPVHLWLWWKAYSPIWAVGTNYNIVTFCSIWTL